MRISDNMRFRSVTRSLASLASEQARTADEASSGKRVNAPSSDAVAAADLIRVQSALTRAATHRNVVRSARGDAELAEGTLAEASSLLVRGHEIAMQGANGTLTADQRATLADEVRQLREQLVTLGNTKGAQGYLFAGTATDSPAFDASGSFLGNDFAHVVEIAPGVTTRVNASGAGAFTAAGGRDVFGDLAALETALRADDQTAVAATLTGLDASRNQITLARADAGLLLSRLDTGDASLAQAELALASRQSAVGDADAFEAFSSLTRLGQTIEQAIAVARETLNGSVLRF